MGWKRRTLIVISILVAGWILVAPLLAEHLVVQRPLEKADAIVILSGSSEFTDRTRAAAAIFKSGISPTVILTDDGLRGPWNDKLRRNPTFAERTRWDLIELGVREEAIEVLPGVVQGTNDEANVLVREIAERGIKSVILVTSAYHSRRALSSFERAMQRRHISLVVGVQSPPQRPGTFWWLTAGGWGTVGLEWVKTAYYSISN